MAAVSGVDSAGVCRARGRKCRPARALAHDPEAGSFVSSGCSTQPCGRSRSSSISPRDPGWSTTRDLHEPSEHVQRHARRQSPGHWTGTAALDCGEQISRKVPRRFGTGGPAASTAYVKTPHIRGLCCGSALPLLKVARGFCAAAARSRRGRWAPFARISIGSVRPRFVSA
jgi:hypothetical protein